MSLTKLALGERLGRFVVECRESEPPPEVVEKLRCNLLHDLSCAFAAHTEGPAVWPVVAGRGPAESTLLCRGEQVDAEHAAFANAVLMHARAQDDTHYAAKTHVGSSVIPPALALAEKLGARWRGFRPGADRRLRGGGGGRRTARGRLDRGRLPRLDALRHARLGGCLRLAARARRGGSGERDRDRLELQRRPEPDLDRGHQRVALGARDGRPQRPLGAGFSPPRRRGARHWFEGDAGFARAFGGAVPAEEEWELGERWRILDVIYKPYPVCNITQSPVEAAIALVSDDDVEAGEVESIRCLLNPADRGYPGTLNWGPFEDVGASLMSAPFCVAMAVKDRDATLAGLHRTDDPVMRELVARTEVLADERLPTLAARIELTTTSGELFVRELVPDAGTYGWDWDGVRANSRRLLAEMAIDEAAFEGLCASIRAPDGARLGGAAGARLVRQSGAAAENRTSVLVGLEEALAEIEDGAAVGIGGAVTAAHPMALVRELARRGCAGSPSSPPPPASTSNC